MSGSNRSTRHGSHTFAAMLVGSLVAVAAFAIAPAAWAQNLFVNGDMENCPASPHNTAPVGWATDSTSAGVDCDYWATGTDPGMYAGTRSPRTQTGEVEGITQAVTTTPAQLYWVSFYVAGNGGVGEIRLNSRTGTLVASAPVTGTYGLVEGSLTATSATTTIYVGTDLTSGSTGDARIDEACISVNPGECSITSAPVCGDGNLDQGELCDDGNTTDCDGCRADCSAVETGCGDTFVCGTEACDDGNTTDCDGCSADCAVMETGCGDGAMCGTEACDDGNTTDCDGCSAICLPETGCGDGVVCGTEQCDDGNIADGDGCSSTCMTEGAGGAGGAGGSTSSGTGGSSSGIGGSSSSSGADGDTGDDSGCGCRVPSGGTPSPWGALGLLGLALVWTGRRRCRIGRH